MKGSKKQSYIWILKWISNAINICTTQEIILADPFLRSIAPYLGITVQNIIEGIGAEIIERQYSKREEHRIGSAIYFALKKVHENTNKGLPIRDDNFLDKNDIGYSNADEFIEALITISQKEYQENKIKYLGYLYANSLFFKKYDLNWFLYFIKIAESLTFRQICFINIFKKKKDYNLERNVQLKKDSYMILRADQRYELYELINLSILRGPREFKPDLALPPEWYNIDWVGNVLYELMNLEEISESEIKKFTGFTNKDLAGSRL